MHTGRTTPAGDDSLRIANAILGDVLTLTRQCDDCWGFGTMVYARHDLGDGVYSVDEDDCTTCKGAGRVPLVKP